jgi:hypothetical protein
MFEPVVPPTLPARRESPTRAPTYKLFDADSVALATFLGSPLAGGVLMAINSHRLGKSRSAKQEVIRGVAYTALAFLLGHFLPKSPSFGVAAALIVAMRQFADSRQRAAVKQHVDQGGAKGSLWVAAGIGLGITAGIVCLVIVGLMFAGGFRD